MEIQKKRVCLILPGKLPVPNIKGGAIETLLTLLLNQNEIHKKVHFIMISPWTEEIKEASGKYENTEFHYFKIRTGIWKKGINFINYVISRWFGIIDFFKTPMHHDIEKIVREIDTDYVIVEHGVYKHFDFLLKYFQRSQLYLHLHGADTTLDSNTIQTFGNIITVSEFVRRFYEKRVPTADIKFHVCLNGIDDGIFLKKITAEMRQRIRSSFGVMEEDLLVIYCGRLIRVKGVKELVQAILDTQNPHIKLMIVGSSNFAGAKKNKYIHDLETLIGNNRKNIFFTGFVSNVELYRYYQSADIQVICSICEEAGALVLAEGRMSKLPQIITDSGGNAEYADPANSILIKKNNSLTDRQDRLKLSAQLTEKLNELYTRYQQNKRLQVSLDNSWSEFDARHFYERFISLFQ